MRSCAPFNPVEETKEINKILRDGCETNMTHDELQGSLAEEVSDCRRLLCRGWNVKTDLFREKFDNIKWR